jgi:hypothetical protein
MQHKRCIHCKENKPISDFNSSTSCKDRLTSACKICLRVQRKQREYKHVIATEKTCTVCDSLQPASCFVPNKSCKDGLNGWCKSCTKDKDLQRKYSISLAQYNRLLSEQSYKCAICGTKDPLGPSGEFVVDHCHYTGKIRGLLCNHCNTGLGKLGDTVESLNKAIRYLSLC